CPGERGRGRGRWPAPACGNPGRAPPSHASGRRTPAGGPRGGGGARARGRGRVRRREPRDARAEPSPSSRLTVPAPTPLDKRTMSARQPRMATYEDILVETRDGVAWITINRPQVLNAFRAKTVDELIAAFRAAWHDTDVGVVVLTGAGERAFSAGGDQSERAESGYGGAGGIGMDMHGLHGIIRAIPKPVIAMVNGWAIGGGHVLHVLCDLT